MTIYDNEICSGTSNGSHTYHTHAMHCELIIEFPQLFPVWKNSAQISVILLSLMLRDATMNSGTDGKKYKEAVQKF